MEMVPGSEGLVMCGLVGETGEGDRETPCYSCDGLAESQRERLELSYPRIPLPGRHGPVSPPVNIPDISRRSGSYGWTDIREHLHTNHL